MRIAVTGTSGVGKTTLATELSRLLNIKLFAENFRPVMLANAAAKAAYLAKDTAKLEREIQLILSWLDVRIAQEESETDFVSDRMAFDILKVVISAPYSQALPGLLTQLIQRCHASSTRFDLVIVPPIAEWSLQTMPNEDGLIREDNLSKKLRSQSVSIGLLEQFCHSPRLYIRSDCVTTEQRVELIRSVLQQLNKVVS